MGPGHGVHRIQANQAIKQELQLAQLLAKAGDAFPGSGYQPGNRKEWMRGLDPNRVRVSQVVWPGTHNSGTNGIGIPFITRGFAECQTLSIYEQLAMGCRVLDVRVQEDRNVCHAMLSNYSVDVVLDDVQRFLSETHSEIIILEIRTEYNQTDPPGFADFLINKLGDHLIRQDDEVFHSTIAQLLPRRVICVWKPRQSPAPIPGGYLWSGQYLKDDWINTTMPKTKFDGNLNNLSQQLPVSERNYFYRVENTATPDFGFESCQVRPVTRRIHWCARLFISQVVAQGDGNKLQVLSTDFINHDLVDACAGFTMARIEGHQGT